MTQDSGYGQFCPVAKASEILTTRWTPLILRELISGSTRFNEIKRGVPLISRALLSKRLKELQAAGVIERCELEGQAACYRLTQAGEELKPIIVAMGVWGQRWVESALASNDWDAGVLMWDMHRRIDAAYFADRRAVVQFDYSDAPLELRTWWMVVERGAVDLCQADPGYDVDLYVASTVPVMARVWIGKKDLHGAVEAEEIELIGDAELRRSIGRWLGPSGIVEAVEQAKAQRAS